MTIGRGIPHPTSDDYENIIGDLRHRVWQLEEIIEVLKGTSPKTNVMRAELLQRINDLENALAADHAEYEEELIRRGWQRPYMVMA